MIAAERIDTRDAITPDGVYLLMRDAPPIGPWLRELSS
jgi:hypothetical protein